MPYENFHNLIEEKIKTVFPEEKLEPRELYDPQRYILALGGKRLRPLLCLIGNDLFDGNVHNALPSALSVELFHNFTLIHDDILDKAPLRRSRETVHKKWNTEIAILSGDALLVKAYSLLTETGHTYLEKLLRLFNKTALEVCEGQQEDMNFETRNHVTVTDYEKMIIKKTAVLLACSLKMGAITAGAKDEDAENLYQFGKNIGIAFQFRDDILDVYADGKKFGKQEAGDIISNKKTFLLLKAIELANTRQLQDINYWLLQKSFDSEEKITAIKKIYGQLNILDLAETESEKYFNIALAHLDHVKAGKMKKETLTKFAKQLMNRIK